MYEMEGPRPARARPRADDSAADAASGSHRVSGTAGNRRLPGSAPRSPGLPGDRPAFGGERFLLPLRQVAQGVRRVITRFFWLSTGRVALIHRARRMLAACPQIDAQAGSAAPRRDGRAPRTRAAEHRMPGRRQLADESAPAMPGTPRPPPRGKHHCSLTMAAPLTPRDARASVRKTA